MVPFQFDIKRSSPSIRPYEHASIDSVNTASQLHAKNLYQWLRDPSRLSQALPRVGSFLVLWPPYW